MAVRKYVVSLSTTSGDPADIVQNTYHFNHVGAPDIAEMTAVCDAITDCYQIGVGGQGNSLNTFLSPAIVRDAMAHFVSVYDAENGGSDLHEINWALGPPGGAPNQLPSEVALCLSYHGDLTGLQEEAPDGPDLGTKVDRPKARRRGRLYYGPFSVNALSAVQAGRPITGLRDCLIGIGDHLLNGDWRPPGAIIDWVVWSTVNQDDTPVVGGWVDNAFDTQRRRGISPTIRDLFPTGP